MADTAVIDESALKQGGAAGVIKPGHGSVQVIYGLNVQFVKDAMDAIMSGEARRVRAEVPAEPEQFPFRGTRFIW